jgi:hypothetical protein
MHPLKGTGEEPRRFDMIIQFQQLGADESDLNSHLPQPNLPLRGFNAFV